VIDNQHRIPRGLTYTLMQPLRLTWLHARAFQVRFARSTRQRVRSLALVVLAVGISCTASVIAAYTYKSEPTPSVASVVQQPIELKASEPPLVAEELPVDTLGVTPSAIWLADRGAGWELYSNGLRIETTYAVNGEPRRYRVHDRNAGLRAEVRSKPVGILFHTSESDIWPLDTGYEKQLRKTSAALLKYVKEQRSYHYVIDRFGRVYRVVDDETRAHHAGNSVWAAGDDVYLDLNSAFLGVSFESRWEGGRTLPITRAQLIAGRNLTNFLRQRFAIAPELCVTHGLTSVNPKKHLVGYHTDWARGFPFAAFGLPDQYAQPPPSVTLFGFGYDDELAQAIGDGWPGLVNAFASVALDAATHGIDVDVWRSQRRTQFLQWAREARIADGDPEFLSGTRTDSGGRVVATSVSQHQPRG
jgi:hypothetical protein